MGSFATLRMSARGWMSARGNPLILREAKPTEESP